MAAHLLVICAGLAVNARARAQGSFEIQIYESELVAPAHTLAELHSNFTIEGSTTTSDGTYPTRHQLHETLEVTHGFADWFELGAYVFTSTQPGLGVNWVGDHIRPRVGVPKEWDWPVGISLSQEFGFQKRKYSVDTWTYELHPIIDRHLGALYMNLSPIFELSVHGANAGQGFFFAPNAKLSFDATRVVTLGVEYYGTLGPVDAILPWADQQQQVFPTVDLNLSPRWEINLGLGVGLTRATDPLISKAIVGYLFDL
ncbi:MAG: hypothetical protein JST54_06820 [Deltaproteobacteria bacterium]|nr:hypothetical protein [Deltaproteobacteria bacterium]